MWFTANLLTGGVDEYFTRTDSSGTANFLTDALGSTIALTDSGGNSQVQYSYGPFGDISITGTTTNSYTYTGRETDGLGLYYYRARYYNPQTGRFISEDPMGLAGGINEYVYVGGDPINFIDPFGLDKKAPNNSCGPGGPAVQIALSGGASVIAPFIGVSATVNIGVNIDGWNSSAFTQGQANGGFGGGAFAGWGLGANVTHGAAPTTGVGSADYVEGDAGFGPGFTGSVAHDEHGCAYSGGTGLGARLGEGAGLGIFAGKQGTVTLATPSVGSIMDWFTKNQQYF